MTKQLFIGLDIGTDSVGWAATDENFNLRRLKGKTAWGARVFSEASDAKSRRMFRTSGRRLARRKERIRLLNTLFDPLLNEKDPTFLLRLENSALQNDDENKPEQAKADCPLFANKTDEKEFYRSYPTIWHLRKALINNEDKAFSDIRFLYLGIHHIIKYRGNFLRSGENDISNFDQTTVLSAFNKALKELAETEEYDDEIIESAEGIGIPAKKFDSFINIANNRKLGKAEKKAELKKIVNSNEDNKAFVEMFCTLVSGGKFSSKKLNNDIEDKYDNVEISFDSSYDENEEKYSNALGDAFDLVEIAKEIYDYCDLQDILAGSNSLSDAFVSIFDAHKKELRELKTICKLIDQKRDLVGENSVYVKIFNEKNNPNNYAAFTHNKSEQKRCDIHTFNKYVLDTLKPYDEEIQNSEKKVAWNKLKELASQDRLLQTIALRSTSIVPMQLHKKELCTILDNAANRKINGIAQIKDKLLSLFEYRIPYYCGPLDNRSAYSNVVFKETANQRVLPWNYKDLVDWDKTKQKFMNGLTNKCSYLKGKDVLPRQSILYQDYDTWNKLNNLMVNGAKLSTEQMNDMFVNFISQRPKTSINDIKKYLLSRSNSKYQDVTISGIEKNDFFNCSSRANLGSCFDLSTRYTTDFKTCERAIFLLTIYCDSPKDGQAAIDKEFDKLDIGKRKALSKLSCRGWSTLSKEFLNLRQVDECGVIQSPSIIDAISNGEGNLMQVFTKYNFQELVDKHNNELFGSLSKKERAGDYIDAMPPKMRRPVIQALRIVKEISKVSKQDPNVIAIEVTRENNDAKTKKKLAEKAASKKEQIEKFLKLLTNNSIEKNRANELKDELQIQDLNALRGKHLYLYFMQNGKDVYSGEPIKIEDVLDGTKYDTDHIIPQSYMKDDSIDNLVLVSRETNQRRSNQFPLPEAIRNNPNNRALWLRLKKAGGMSDKKYNNLIRATELSEEELASFVAAQINVVNRSNVVLRDVLKIYYPNTKLIFSKAQYPSQIRQELSIPKLRDLNDTHHAVDAYLNIVAGVSLTNKFGNMKIIKEFVKKSHLDEEKSLNMARYISSLIKNKNGDLKEFGRQIDLTSRRHDFLLTYRFDYQDNAFYDQTICKKSDSTALVRLHDSMDTARYGGYNKAAIEANCIAEIIGRKETKRFLLGVPHILIQKHKRGIDITEDLKQLVPHKDGDAIKINLDYLLPLGLAVKKCGFEYLLVSRNSDQIVLKPFSPVFLTRDSEIYLNNLMKSADKYRDEFANAFGTKIIKIDKGGLNQIIFTAEESKVIAKELFDLAEQKIFDYCPMISDLRLQDFKNKINEEIEASSFAEQAKILKGLVGRFTRKSLALTNKFFSKSRLTVMKENLIICSDSITGLYSSERKL